MMYKIAYLSTWLFLLACTATTKAQTINDSLEIALKPYAGLRGNIAAHSGQMELQENASRIGAELTIKKGKLGFVAGTEIQVNMFKGSSSFNLDGNLSGGFLQVQTAQSQQVFGNRLGYLGIDFGTYGKVTIGKQWSVYRDITSYTDKFNVFGGRASATFIGGTDGGENGTGRADQSIIYRSRIGSIHVGGQLQLRGGNNDKFVDGFALSAQMEVIKDVFLGTAYNRAFLSYGLRNTGQVLGLNGHPSYWSAGAKYQGKQLVLSAVAAIQENGDFTQGQYIDMDDGIIRPTVVFNARGIEVFSKYTFQKFHLLAGYNHYLPTTTGIPTTLEEPPLDPKFEKRDIIAGIAYQPFEYVQIYSEQRFSAGRTVTGEKDKNVFTVGLKMDIYKNFVRTKSI